MTQSQLDRAVARATGESLSTIRHRGFTVVEMPTTELPDDPAAPQVVDWDALEAARTGLLPRQTRRQRLAA
jgi:hypothetical protein